MNLRFKYKIAQPKVRGKGLVLKSDAYRTYEMDMLNRLGQN